MKAADVVLYLFDVNTTTVAALQAAIENFNKEQIQYLLIANKIDAMGETKARQQFAGFENCLFIAAKTSLHTDLIKERLVDTVLKGRIDSEATVVTNARHFHAMKEVAQSLEDIKAAMDNKIPGDLLALDIRRCLHYIGEITGEITNEDQLDYIFSKFCIGK
jgi:tRNA modification GTPase